MQTSQTDRLRSETLENLVFAAKNQRWSYGRRIISSVPVFAILMFIFASVSGLTDIVWKLKPYEQSISTMSDRTDVEFENPGGQVLPKRGTYEVAQIRDTIALERPGTGEIQNAAILVRFPKNAEENAKLPAVVFMHGAGYGTADNSFGDVSEDLASAGFVALTVDKPVWSTNDLTRDYPASAHAYEQCIQYLRNRADVDPDRAGIYATSESAWISPAVAREDGRLAFQILLSPMTYNPRQSLAFMMSQDMSIIGAHTGYRQIFPRILSISASKIGLDNFDFDPHPELAAYVPTFVAWGAKDVMTSQVGGTYKIVNTAKECGNSDITIRNYPIGNHVLRLGDEAEEGTPFVDKYENDMVSWAVGTVRNLKQTTPAIAGSKIVQSISVPTEAAGHDIFTYSMFAVHLFAFVMIAVAVLVSLLVFAKYVYYFFKPGLRVRDVLGLTYKLRMSIVALFAATVVCAAALGTGFGTCAYEIVKLVWGAAPSKPGYIVWSWNIVQILCVSLVWVWSRVLVSFVETGVRRGKIPFPNIPVLDYMDTVAAAKRLARNPKLEKKRAARAFEPVFASTRLGRVYFAVFSLAMFSVLLLMAFWGIYVFW